MGFILTLLFLNETDKISIHINRAGAGITDLLSWKYDYLVIQTYIQYLRTPCSNIMTKHVFWLNSVNSYHLRAQLRYWSIATQLFELLTIVSLNTEHKCLYYRPQCFIEKKQHFMQSFFPFYCIRMLSKNSELNLEHLIHSTRGPYDISKVKF